MTQKASVEKVEGLPDNGQILIISKATSTRLCLAYCLVDWGYKCTFVNSESDARIYLEERDFDAIVYSNEHFMLFKSVQQIIYSS